MMVIILFSDNLHINKNYNTYDKTFVYTPSSTTKLTAMVLTSLDNDGTKNIVTAQRITDALKEQKLYRLKQNTLLIEDFKSSASSCLLVFTNIYLITITTRQACRGFDLALIRRNRGQNTV